MNKNRSLILISMYVALAITLDYIKEFIPFLNMPSGGSINIALIPVVLSSFHLGPKKGMLVGYLWWQVSFILGLNKWFISVPQYLLDYIVPSLIVGLCSIFYKNKNQYDAVLGIIVMMFIRTISIVISGAIYWPEGGASGSIPAWIYSLSYNLPYSLVTLLMLVIVIPILIKSLKKYLI